MATLLIIGASRGIGFETVKAALHAGHTVRALARSAATIPITHSNLQKITGNALNQSDVERALEGADAAVQSVGVGSLRDLVIGTDLFSKSTRVLIDAMQAKRVRRLIAVTGAGAGDSRGRNGFGYDYVLYPLLLARIYADKDIAETMIRASGLDWTIVRPGILKNGDKTGNYLALPDMKDWRTGAITRADVADFLVKQIDDTRFVERTPLLIAA